MKNQIQIPQQLICFSHLRWDFVYQRPQHLLSRFAQNVSVFFYEEPQFHDGDENYLSLSERKGGITIVVPHLSSQLSEAEIEKTQTIIFDDFISHFDLDNCMFWYYTPMALKFSEKHKAGITVYDCMDELQAFKFAHPDLAKLEKKLMAKADLVFTGGHSLYDAKKHYHSNIHPFPSSIDKQHFSQSRTVSEAQDQQKITGPKIGFFGVIDERFDIELIKDIADKQPTWQLILIGPVVKIDAATLPKRANIHYLGQRSYQELPSYLAGWDVALIPFMLNESTRYISPTKTPEYLAANIPVVSTPIRDVVQPYGVKKLVHIGKNCEEFVAAIASELHTNNRKDWETAVSKFLSNISWDHTYQNMQHLITETLQNIHKISIAS